MNPVEEAVAGDVGAEPAGGPNDHGQLNPRWAQQVLARGGVCRSGSTSLGLGHGPNLLAGAEIRAPPGPEMPGASRVSGRGAAPAAMTAVLSLSPRRAAQRDSLPTITSTNRRQLAEQFAEALLVSAWKRVPTPIGPFVICSA